jgi:type II secretory pathway pseudopilin PulG
MKRSREAGFSAIELVAIAAIIIIIAAIALPNVVTARRSYLLQIGAEGLAQQLQRCRQEAVRVNDRMQILVTSQQTRIDLNRDGEFDDEDGPVARITEEATITEITPDTGIVEYTSRGEIDAGVVPSFSVVSSGYKRVVTIDPRGAVLVGPEIPV